MPLRDLYELALKPKVAKNVPLDIPEPHALRCRLLSAMECLCLRIWTLSGALFPIKIQPHAHCTCPGKVLNVSGTHTCDQLATEPSVSLWLHHLSLPTTFCLGGSGSNLNTSPVVICLPLAPLGNLGNTMFSIRGRSNESNRERCGVIWCS